MDFDFVLYLDGNVSFLFYQSVSTEEYYLKYLSFMIHPETSRLSASSTQRRQWTMRQLMIQIILSYKKGLTLSRHDIKT